MKFCTCGDLGVKNYLIITFCVKHLAGQVLITNYRYIVYTYNLELKFKHWVKVQILWVKTAGKLNTQRENTYTNRGPEMGVCRNN